ncbi:unnamed protein product [Owenia fusiformis]|uniref:Uncharacterized protein n=1 Tax=Owenia fusiformis TaxID=6347 RepID=A0A8J1TB21_OWEFU|nr:unnamed protein product [Owenia fusiformis]
MTDYKETDPLLTSTKGNIQEDVIVKTAPKSRPRINRLIVEPVIFLYFLAFTPSITLTEQYVFHVVGKEYQGSDTDASKHVQGKTQCDVINETVTEAKMRDTIQANASKWMMYLNIAILVPQLVMVPILGAYSDRGGRKIIILLSIAGTCLNYIANVIIIYLDLGIKYWILGCVIQGISGGASALMSACFAYIADIVELDDRSFRITALNAVLGVSGAAAQLGIGYWITYDGYLPSFWFISCVLIVNIFYVIFFVPESKQQNTNDNFNPFWDLKNAVMLYYKTDESERNRKLLILIITFALASLVSYGSADVLALFMLNRPLCWTSVLIGIFTAMSIIMWNIGGMVGVKLFERWLTDEGMILLAALFFIAMQAFQAFVKSTFMMFIGPVIGMFGSMFLPLISSIMSKTVRDDEQGALFAGIGCIGTATTLAGGALYNTIYAETVDWFGGFVFLVTAGIFLLAIVTFWIYVKMSGTHLLHVVSKQEGRLVSVLADEPLNT